MSTDALRRVLRASRTRASSLSSALVITVPEAEVAAGLVRALHDPGAKLGIAAHITVLTPFVPARRITPGVVATLANLAAAVTPFHYRLASVGHFPGVTYLAPEDPRPFVRLTEQVVDCWPEHPPFNGAYDEVVPHLTLAEGPHDSAGLAATMQAALPIDAVADELTLLCQKRGGQWHAERTFPFAALA